MGRAPKVIHGLAFAPGPCDYFHVLVLDDRRAVQWLRCRCVERHVGRAARNGYLLALATSAAKNGMYQNANQAVYVAVSTGPSHMVLDSDSMYLHELADIKTLGVARLRAGAPSPELLPAKTSIAW